MGEQENCTKKRAFATMSAVNKEKRVVLGELTNSVVESDFADKTRNTAPKLRKPVQPEIVMGSDDDSRKCGFAALIYKHLRSLEVNEKRRPLPDYMDKVQKDVTVGMREILVDWLVEIVDEYKLVSDTLYLTLSYIDRFLSSHALSRNKLQLLGVSSMLIASKYEDISPPHVEDFCYMTDNTYTKEEVVDMEKEILKFLNFEISSPTTKTFLRIFTKVAQQNYTLLNLHFELLACYLAELSLLDYGLIRFVPSVVAASVIFLSKFTIQPEKHPWTSALQQYSGYKASELKDCVLAIHDLQLCRRGKSLQAVREKYMLNKSHLSSWATDKARSHLWRSQFWKMSSSVLRRCLPPQKFLAGTSSTKQCSRLVLKESSCEV